MHETKCPNGRDSACVSRDCRILLFCISGSETERTHQGFSFLHISVAPGLITVKTGDSACIQDRFGQCIFSHTDPSDSQEYQLFAFQNKVYHFKVLQIGLNTAPQLLTRLGHTVAGDLHRKGILVLPCIDDCLVHYLDILLNHQLLLLQIAELVGFNRTSRSQNSYHSRHSVPPILPPILS